jgi:hypothetical protein
MAPMARVVRLETVVTLRERGDGFASYSARLDAVLDEGRRVVLLDDRGWSEQTRGPRPWPSATREEIAFTARTVVGPDEPPPGRTAAEEDDLHWDSLARTLGAQGISIDPAELRALPHDVLLY